MQDTAAVGGALETSELLKETRGQVIPSSQYICVWMQDLHGDLGAYSWNGTRTLRKWSLIGGQEKDQTTKVQ